MREVSLEIENIKKTCNRVYHYNIIDDAKTYMHLTAMGGLCATIYYWQENPEQAPQNIQYFYDEENVCIGWNDADISNYDALENILKSAFKLTSDGIIYIVGQLIPSESKSEQLIRNHSCILRSFLTHSKHKEKKSQESIVIERADNANQQNQFTIKYDSLTNYQPHIKTAKSLKKSFDSNFKKNCFELPSWMVIGCKNNEVDFKTFLLLHFLKAGSLVYTIKKHNKKDGEYNDIGIFYPQMSNFVDFVDMVSLIRSNNNYISTIRSSCEDVVLEFLLHINLNQSKDENGWEQCIHTMVGYQFRKFTKNFSERIFSFSFDFLKEYKHLALYNTVITNSVVRTSDFVKLISINVANNNHWLYNFDTWCISQKKIGYYRKVFVAMMNTIKSESEYTVDSLVIDYIQSIMYGVFNQYWHDFKNKTLCAKYAKRFIDSSMSDFKRARVHTSFVEVVGKFISRTKYKYPIDIFTKEQYLIIQNFLFDYKNFPISKNLCLFALQSYSSKVQFEKFKEYYKNFDGIDEELESIDPEDNESIEDDDNDNESDGDGDDGNESDEDSEA